MKTWVEKYRPEKLRDIAGNPTSIEALVNWAEEWKHRIPNKRAVLLHGPAGSGKTSTGYALARELNYDCIELNASDARTYEVINRIVGSASSLGTLSPEYAKKIIILDEVDGIHGKFDYGGLNALKKWICITLQPVVLIANDAWSLPKEFRALTLMVEFKKIEQRSILKVLKDISSKEGIKTDEKVLKLIATNANGDLRAAINDIQGLAEGKNVLSLRSVDMLTMRDSEKRIFDVLRRVFKASTCDMAREGIYDSDEEPDTILKWIDENLPLEYEDPRDLADGFNYLSRADVFLGRIQRNQEWRLLSYAVELMSAGVGIAKRRTYGKFTYYQYPKSFVLYAQTKKQREFMDSAAAKIGEKLHCSKIEARTEYFPFLSAMMKNLEMGANIASELELTLDEIKFFSEEFAEKIYERASKITADRIKAQTKKEATKQVSLFEFSS